MAPTTRGSNPRTLNDLETHIITITGLDTDQWQKVHTEGGVKDTEGLSYLTFEDIEKLLPDCNVVTKRKFERLCTYVYVGGVLSLGMNMATVNKFLQEHEEKQTTRAPVQTKDPMAYNAKFQTDSLDVFSGDPEDFEDWLNKTFNTVNQTILRKFLQSPPDLNKQSEIDRDRDFYYAIKQAVEKGTASHVVSSLSDSEQSGHIAWTKLKEWYQSPGVKDDLIDLYQQRAEQLRLTPDVTASEYINSWVMCQKKLTELGSGYSDLEYKRRFVRGIDDEDFKVKKEMLTAEKHEMSIQDLITEVRRAESGMNLDANKLQKVKARRIEIAKTAHQSNNDGTKKFNIPYIPNYIMSQLNNPVQKDLLHWRYIWNKEGREVKHTELPSNKKDEESEESVSPNDRNVNGGKKRKRKKKSSPQNSTVRRTKITTVGTKDESDVKCTMLSDTDNSNDNTSAYYDSVTVVPRIYSSAACSRRFHPIRRNVGNHSTIVLDSGTEATVAGGGGWTVHSYVNSTGTFGGALASMQSCELPLANVCTVIETEAGSPLIIGLGGAAFDNSPGATEALINTHHLRDNGVMVDDIAKVHGGEQKLTICGYHIPLTYEPSAGNSRTPEGKIMTLKCRKPTQKELENLEIFWLSPFTPGLTKDPEITPPIRRKAKVVPNFQNVLNGKEEGVDELINKGEDEPQQKIDRWKDCLANPPVDIVKKTLDATTRFCEAPVEMENREAMRQHRKQRILPLHPRRIKGRTDSDTFFSSVKSVRGYRCVQLFVCLLSDYLYIKCLRRESHSHSAYQDFIREVGAPNTLLTDNSQTQTGELWTETSRKNATRQIHSVPHNQNQNTAERKVQDAKHRTSMTLQYSKAPLLFWCYCLYFVIDCLNFTAKKKLNWRTPMEVLNGETPDISMFRFKFWEPVWYYENPAKWPSSTKLPGRWIGIAWNHGDDFTYRIWTTPENDWRKGREIIRNVVMCRHDEKTNFGSTSTTNATYDTFTMDKVKKVKRKGKKRKRQSSNAGMALSPQDLDIPEGPIDLPAPNTRINNDMSETPGAEDITASTDDTIFDFNPKEGGDLEMVDEINNEISSGVDPLSSGGGSVMEILAHRWKEGRLQLEVLWNTEEKTWEEFRDIKLDKPRLTAQYIIDNKPSRKSKGSRGPDRNYQWAKKTLRDLERAIRRLRRLYDFYFDDCEHIQYIRRVNKKRKKKRNFGSHVPQFKYGIEVPRNVKRALELDRKNKNSYWADAIKKEVTALTDVDCFDFKDPDFKPDATFQRTTLHIVFDVKQDLRRKARLVAGGHLVDILDHPVYSSMVKGISIRLLNVIAHKAGLRQLVGDIGNAYVNAYTNEKVYAIAGKEFGELEGHLVVIKKALYGLATSGERWHKHFADTLLNLGFQPTRYDRDVWLRKYKDGKTYEYICIHVDDFCITSKDPESVMESIKAIYNVKSSGKLNYFLGNDYKLDKKGRQCVGCKTFILEAINRVEKAFGNLPKNKIPMTSGDHPEEDATPLLNDADHRKYQSLIGMLTWSVVIGRFDIAFATASLSRFSSCPREGHLKRVLRVFSYLKGRPNLRLICDSRDPIFEDAGGALRIDFTAILKDQYPWAQEEIDINVPEPLIQELAITCFVDSDHSHDTVTRRSITGLVIFLGRTPVLFQSKRQGAIETSTYSSEFCAMKNAVEEVHAMRYMLRCLGVKVEHATPILGDNKAVIQNSTLPDSLLKKKHVAIAYHKTRESAAAGVVHPVKTKGDWNFADILTKATTANVHSRHITGMSRG